MTGKKSHEYDYYNTPERRKRHQRYVKARKKAYTAAKREIIAAFRSNGCCICEERTPECLHAHHLDPTLKEFSISRGMHAVSIEKFIAELEKCVCLCANCHIKVHIGDAKIPDNRIPYGSRPQSPPQAGDRRLPVSRPRKFDPTREELESLVWSMPSEAVARIYGVSGNAVTKRCRVLGIRKPPRGWWSKRTAERSGSEINT